MGIHWKDVAEKIIESVESYNISIETVAPLVEKYADKNLMDWQCFIGWSVVDGGRNIEINYTYEDYWSNTETYTEVDSITVPLEDVLKMMWSDDMSLEELQAISPVFKKDVYDAISMETCVNTRLTIGAPSETAMKQVIVLEEDYLVKNPVIKA